MADFILPDSKAQIMNFFTSNNKKVIMTHNDLDGVACKIIASLYADVGSPYGVDAICPDKWETTLFSGPKALDDYFINNGLRKTKDNPFIMDTCDILITDLCVSPKVAKWIDVLNNTPGASRVYIIDHHVSNSAIAKYPWAYIDVHERFSATKILYGILKTQKLSYLGARYVSGEDKTLDIFVNAVSAYDLGKYDSEPESDLGIILNRAFMKMGWLSFSESMIAGLSKNGNGNINFLYTSSSSVEYQLPYDVLNAARKKQKEDELWYDSLENGYFMMDNMQSLTQGYRTALTFLSIYGHGYNCFKFLKKHPEIDILMAVNLKTNTCSMRTEKDHINLSAIASKFGGGGHKLAAAFKMNISGITVTMDTENGEEKIVGTR